MNHAAHVVAAFGTLVIGCSAEPSQGAAPVDAAVERPVNARDVVEEDNTGNDGSPVRSDVQLDDEGAVIDVDAASPVDAETGPDAAPPAARPFACSKMVGLWVMSQWWGTFEKGVDDARWEYIFVHHGYLEMWADPASPYWKTTVISPCATHPEAPDRVIFLPFSLALNTLDQWQTNITKVVQAIQTNLPSVQRIELISTIRSPGNQPCPNDQDPNIVVPAYVDQAIQNVADASGGLVTVGPKIAVANCNWWVGGTDLTGAGNTGVGQLYADYYKDH